MKQNYDQADIAAMQQDAIRRVKEMDRRAKRHLQPTSSPAPQGETLPERRLPSLPQIPGERNKPSAPPQKSQPSSSPFLPLQNILGGLGIEGDRILILALLLVLLQEETDPLLLLALLYLFL